MIKEKVAFLSIIANLFLVGAKISTGLFSHSTLVLAEGIHSLMDVFFVFDQFLGN